MTRIAVAVAATLAALAACAQDIRFVPGQGPAEALTDTERAVALLAIDTLAADLKVPREKIELDTVRAIDWRDSSLGCPKPGMAYLDVITPGHKVTLRVDGQIYVVHEARQQGFRLPSDQGARRHHAAARAGIRAADGRGPAGPRHTASACPTARSGSCRAKARPSPTARSNARSPA